MGAFGLPYFKEVIMATPYSTVAQYRGNIPSTETNEYSDPSVEGKIIQADSMIEQDLANIIDFSLVPNITADPATPTFINLLSQYKVAEMSLTAIFGAKREVTEVSDIQYWQKMYSNPEPRQGETLGLLERIKNGSIPLELSDGTAIGTGVNTFTRDAKPGIEPALGLGKRGAFKNNTELLQDRPERD